MIRRSATQFDGSKQVEHPRDNADLDITWLKDPLLTDADDGIPPEIIAEEIVEELTAALADFSAVADALAARAAGLARREP